MAYKASPFVTPAIVLKHTGRLSDTVDYPVANAPEGGGLTLGVKMIDFWGDPVTAKIIAHKKVPYYPYVKEWGFFDETRLAAYLADFVTELRATGHITRGRL